MFRKLFKWLIIMMVLVTGASGLYTSYTVFRIYRESRQVMGREAINRVTASESPVFYDDGETPIGVFFQQVHKRNIQYADIPKVFIKAILAAEDKDFFTHHGIDLKGLLRAAIVNLRAGKVVQGGSTITQQTAKNIFNREARSFRSKFREIIQAWLLERIYTKEEILEIYVNQFFVTGFGKGLGVASQYFFDKESKDLDLVEACFIAGSLKGPNRYNPFIKITEKEKAEARRLAKLRKDYVLENMFSYHFISEQEYQKAKAMEVPFKEGKVTYGINVILDYVREQLESDYFKTVLSENGIENIATSGIKIHTSVNKELQEAALTALRKHIPILDIGLNGIKGISTEENSNVILDIDKITTEDKSFILAKIITVEKRGGESSIKVNWDGGEAQLKAESLNMAAGAWVQWKYGPWAILEPKRLESFLDQFRPGDRVVLQKKADKDGGGPGYVLSSIPALNGAIIAMHKGMVKAMVGGFQNRHFNRAVHAKRQVGSIFKPILYVAALQLKWNILDRLLNTPEIYRFQTTTYAPRPDHEVQSNEVSLAWAGVKSENLATVWLLYHLTDHLNPSEFYETAKIAGLTRKENETLEDYRIRIRDKHGIVVNAVRLKEAAFEKAKETIEPDLIFGGMSDVLDRFKDLTLDDVQPPPDTTGIGPRLGYHTLRSSSRAMKEDLIKALTLKDQVDSDELLRILGRFFRTADGIEPSRIFFSRAGARPRTGHTTVDITAEWWKDNAGKVDPSDVFIEGLFQSKVLDMLEDAMAREKTTETAADPYDFKWLSQLRDFRTLVNIGYMTYLARKIGISTELDPVLSFPLGPNAISLLETCLAYHTVMTGNIVRMSDESEPGMVPIITRIEDSSGAMIWELNPKEEKVLSRRTSCLIAEVLRNVMTEGTGKRAKNSIKTTFGDAEGAPTVLPVFGKTGTANRFTNSSFVGFLPAPTNDKGVLGLNEGYVIAAYVGYDDNRPMQSRNTSIYGSTGALPLWVETANAVVRDPLYRKRLQPAELAFGTPEIMGECAQELVEAFVSPISGLPVKKEDGVREAGYVKIYHSPERRFEPVKGSEK
ncbi:MAG: hypothetical protein C4582_12080 [Desulfobacteraceae bacterium]|nr:MAG: hypothetical protein C4582_12080 [Desulfobacteraceae bacterium]